LAERQEFWDFVATCREIISRQLPEYERVIGLTAPNQKFRSKLTDAIMACVFTHILTPYHRRASSLRKDLSRARKEARSAQNSLRRLADILDDLPQALCDQLTTHWGILGKIRHRSLEGEISWLQQGSVITSVYTKRLKTLDRGGAPKMRAFEVLRKGLADAYQSAKGRRGITWNEYGKKWGGEFVELVRAVLPLATKLAEKISGRPLRIPRQGTHALGKYLDMHTDAPKKK